MSDGTDENISSNKDSSNVATKNDATDITGITGITREVLLQKENEYLMKKITEELSTWSDNNAKSAGYTIVSIVISAIALLFGVVLFIFEKSSYRQEVKNIISTSVIGTGGSVTLLGSLASLKHLFQQASEETKDFEKTLESFQELFKEPKKEGDNVNKENEIDKKKIKKIKELENHLEDQKKIYIFLDELNKHMQRMSICRSISVSITSLIFIMLAIVSIFYLLFKEDETIFKKIDIFLISFSSYCLLYSICVMICIQVIIPSVTEKMLDPDYADSFENYCSTRDISDEEKFKKYKSKVSLTDLLGFLFYRIHRESWFISIIDSIKCIVFILLLFCFVLIGLISLEIPSFKLIIKRISMGKIEFEGINRVRYGLPLNKHYWIKQKKEGKELEIKQIKKKIELNPNQKEKEELELDLEKFFDELLELDKELGLNKQKELNLKLDKNKLEIKLLQKKRKKESDLNKQKDLDLELKQKKLDREKIQMELFHENNIALNVFKQKKLKIELDRIKLKLILENQKEVPDKEEIDIKKKHRELKGLKLKLLKKESDLEKAKQKIDSDLNIQNLVLVFEIECLDLLRKELKLTKKQLNIDKVKGTTDSDSASRQREQQNLNPEPDIVKKKKELIEKATKNLNLELEGIEIELIKRKLDTVRKEIELIEKKLKIIKKEIEKEIEPLDQNKQIELVSELRQETLKNKLQAIVDEEVKELDQIKHEIKFKNVKDAIAKVIEKLKLEKVKEAIEKLDFQKVKEEIKKLELENIKVAIEHVKNAIENVKKAIEEELDDKDKQNIIEKLKSKTINQLRTELKQHKLELIKIELEKIEVKIELKEIESKEIESKEKDSDSEKQRLKLELKQKTLELKQKALEQVRIEIKLVQENIDSEEYKGIEPILNNIKKKVLILELKQKVIKQELVEIKIELDQNKEDSDSKKIDELKSDSRHIKIELVKKEIEWTQKKLELIKKEIELKLESQLKSQSTSLFISQLKIWCMHIQYFLKFYPQDEDQNLKKIQNKLEIELNSKKQELWYRRIKYHLNIDCKNFLFKNLNIKKLYIYDNINNNVDEPKN
ncbi:hypothetical protein F8M41_016812 [Gigaspora margarita]|uniref:Uncharacterized protein n=1 Tax=Gigaspora margarita TaxID=4874 RepID=A0A8H4EMD8_GIGMA|nr:hypothetical protein F8M41_016812 [Gigaspora margarita]